MTMQRTMRGSLLAAGLLLLGTTAVAGPPDAPPDPEVTALHRAFQADRLALREAFYEEVRVFQEECQAKREALHEAFRARFKAPQEDYRARFKALQPKGAGPPPEAAE